MKHNITTAKRVLIFSVVFSSLISGVGLAAMGDTPAVVDKSKDASAQTLEEVQAIIVARWLSLKSAKASILTTKVMDTEHGKTDMTSQGQITYMRRDGKNYFIKDLKSLGTSIPVGRPSREIKTKTKNICSGDTCYYIMSREKNRDKVFMSKVEKVTTDFGGQGLLDYLGRLHTLKLHASEVLNGHKVFVLEAMGNPDTSYVKQTIKAFVDEKTGMVRKIVTKGEGHSMLVVTKYHNIELNPQVDPKIFDYTPSSEVHLLQKVIKN